MEAATPTTAVEELSRVLRDFTREGTIGEPEGDGGVRCRACGHECFIPKGRVGVCKVRFNDGGRLRVPWGYVAALQCDPIEKKPFFHAFPGSLALSFGMLGCDYHCGYCQNWITSQALRDPEALAPPRPITAAALAQEGARRGARVLASTYNEPLITSEWAAAVFDEGRTRGLLGAYISNGNGTEPVLDFIRPHLSLYKIDLKSFRDRTYRTLGGTLQAVLRTIESVHRRGLWLEIVTLLVPGLNDSDAEIRGMAGFLADVSRDIPWHVTAFHPDYRMADRDRTAAATLLKAAALGKDAGLRFVYAGNLPGRVGDLEDTRCPGCGLTLIARRGFVVLENRLGERSVCPRCDAPIPGVWTPPAPASPGARGSDRP
jgi:pyruvate formate lyase activating enzyme